ncbi:MAG: hypothetical protein ACK4M9_03780 [Anaerobacillus sp.]|uniref:hypothetical protein n=1 Tax=Anaerobacillus sp. TaxID=1872506 RepID=UPI00391CD01C
MNKNDFRVRLPLWNIALLVILLIWTYGVVYMSNMLFKNFEGVFGLNDETVVINFDKLALLSIILGAVLLLIFLVSYYLKLNKHNKENPNSKLPILAFFKLGEYIEEDEMFNQVTQQATKKVYTFYSQILPLLLLIMIFPLNRFVFIICVFLMLILQNVLYYRQMIKFIEA